MQHDWAGPGWISHRTREALLRALAVRRGGARPAAGEAELHAAFVLLCDEAIRATLPPEAVLDEFRACWDTLFPRLREHEPRDLLYYGTLSQCLDVYLQRREGRGWLDASRCGPSASHARPGHHIPITS